MKASLFAVQGMDCTAEEQLVRMALDTVPGITKTDVDLDERTVTVHHQTETGVVLRALESVKLGAELLNDDTGATVSESAAEHQRERKVLTIALVINAAFFVAEIVAGILGRSMGLIADSLDMLADASVYALSLLAVGGSMLRKTRLAAMSGYLQLGLAVVGVAEVLRRFFGDEQLPDVKTMILVSFAALAGNIATLLILKRAKSPEAHFQASWIFTANDIKVNGLVIVAAIVVAVTNNPAADLIAGALIFLIVANGSRRILALSREQAAA